MSFTRTRSHKKLDEPALYEYAITSLGRKMRTVAELKRLLRARVVEGESGDALVEAVITRLKDQKYLNDSRYALAYSQYRQSNEKFGRRRVITDLKVKGVHSEVIAKAVATAYAQVDEEQLARQFLQRKRIKRPVSQRESARIFRMLMRAGFSLGMVHNLLKHWDVDEELLSRLEEESSTVES